ncbi:hypothetical protein A2778_04280 [Candidatus Daviesbacteria bacterium RIFCSPHIGHO2_01_FULL_40_24]|nr:MAG: hypothetical protein A2778_04280 [Candidatus Daviesbacteria bacterium RIFCSPHIGHO2_01_FULL_40_24]OGE30126.1 MAG: hypothetical protein A3C29_01840 [Candidatus Daviesbacteria bacterium RIFCSPHIGHO2_02_FULL_40_16]OGE43438.1 MAG: hypothetical protein A3A53_02270 [Candidatus Daviesbacteria bacterium RIFCSPLOWO2_01_FULL_39_23]OGE67711.1 MAG: hypothetical protein A3J16_02150 [Candidatus Daviesbacteria bacterium RIFCSPLOWO2_02_FULL_39_13]
MKNNPDEKFLIEELRKNTKAIFIPKKNKLTDNQWLGNILMLKKQILSENPKNFLQWNVIRKTMFIGNALFTIKEFLYLRINNWNKWKKTILESNYVPTEPYILYPGSSGNLIHQAYHIARFEKISGQRIEDFDSIFEFGGGYGSMCQLIHNLGFKGNYIIFDLPVFSTLQAFFLKMNGLDVNPSNMSKKAKILCKSNLNEVKKIIPKKGKKLFIATWSLSESPLPIRKKIYPLIDKVDSHLISYQAFFGKVDNRKYFADFRKKMKKKQWYNQEILQLKNNYYLFGF